MAQRLLERVASGVFASSARDDADLTRSSVRYYVEALINTRRGGNGSRPDFGLPGSGEDRGAAGETGADIARAVRQCFADFEPRLHRIDVRSFEARPGVLLVEGKLRLNHGYERVTYEIDLEHGGTLSVT